MLLVPTFAVDFRHELVDLTHDFFERRSAFEGLVLDRTIDLEIDALTRPDVDCDVADFCRKNFLLEPEPSSLGVHVVVSLESAVGEKLFTNGEDGLGIVDEIEEEVLHIGWSLKKVDC